MSEGELRWKSYKFNLPNGLLSYATRAAIDGDNLNTCGNPPPPPDAINCKLCGNQSTLLHILNGYKTAHDQGRYTFRHNGIVSNLVKCLKENVNYDTKVFADIKGSSTNGGTIPADIVPIAEKPDIVCVDYSKKSISTYFKLTKKFENSNFF